MSGIYGVSNTSGSSLFDSMLGTGNSSQSTSSVGLSDYAMIRSGAYKKLLNAYYKNESSSKKSETEEKAEKVSLTSARSDAKALAKSSSALVNADYSEDNREDVVSKIKAYVEDYNKVIKGSDDVEDTTVLRNTLWLTQQTQAHSESLSKLGITIGEGNELKLDADKLSSADLSTMKALFSGYASYGSYIAGKSSQIQAAANAALTANGSGSAYTSRGSYFSALTGNIVDTDV